MRRADFMSAARRAISKSSLTVTVQFTLPPAPGAYWRIRNPSDIPFRPGSSEVILNVGIEAIRAASPHVAKLQLVAVDDSGDHILGEYTFNHTPSLK